MDEYYRAVSALPEPLAQELSGLNTQVAPFVQEIRLRAQAPVLFTIRGKLMPCIKFLPKAQMCANLTKQSLQSCFLALCRHSVYAYEEELRQGYLTVSGGNRIGVAGTAGPAGFSMVTSLNLRVARQIVCEIPAQILAELSVLSGGVLVAGPPGSGKTTFLRSLVHFLARSERVFCVVDERGELLGGTVQGLPPENSPLCDVYTQIPKAQGILMALRTMNPQAILCDELGSGEDVRAVEAGLACGVVFIASVHCGSTQELTEKPQLRRLLATGAFGMAVFLDGREHPGKVASVLKL